jgi:preprotein translocase subunit YajC
MNLLSILLQSPAPGGGGYGQILFLVLIIVVFYFFMIRPQTKKAKLEKEFRESLQKGAKIVTIGGMHGRILEVNGSTFMIEIDTNVKVRIEKTAVAAEATKALNANGEKAK